MVKNTDVNSIWECIRTILQLMVGVTQIQAKEIRLYFGVESVYIQKQIIHQQS